MFIQRRDKEDNLYQKLQKHSLRMLQELSGKIWTDFNEHDPGVTFLDLLNYAFLELDYQINFDFEQYISKNGNIDFSEIGLLPAKDIFAKGIVTVNDYEKLVEENINEVEKCKLEPLENNHYNIFIDIEDNVDKDEVIKKVTSLYHENRNLCENLNSVIVKHIHSEEDIRIDSHILFNQEYEKIKNKKKFSITHQSIQNELPDTYGINEKGLPKGVSKERKAQALQLKAYLLIFDYMLSATKQQLNSISELLSFSEQNEIKFSNNIDIDDIEKLINTNKLSETNVFKVQEQNEIKSKYLDMLDAIYGEDTSIVSKYYKNDLSSVNKKRIELIKLFPHLNTRRFCSFNIQDEELKTMPSIKILMHFLWDNKQEREVSLSIITDKLPRISNITFYIIEHLLLQTEDYSIDDRNKISLVFPYNSKAFIERDEYRDIIMERLPIHLDVNFSWLETEDMSRFEQYYFYWRKALAKNDKKNISETSKQIRIIIEHSINELYR